MDTQVRLLSDEEFDAEMHELAFDELNDASGGTNLKDVLSAFYWGICYGLVEAGGTCVMHK